MDFLSGTQNMGNQAMMAMAQSQTASAGSAVAMSGGRAVDMDGLKKAANDFESVFISQMFNHMFEGLGEDSVFGGGQGEAMFRPMLVEEYSKLMVKRGGLGLADSVMHTLIKQQEKAA